MKKILFVLIIMLATLDTFSYSPGIGNTNVIVPGNATITQSILNLTPKKYFELTGKRMTFKQKIALAILKAKLKRGGQEEEKVVKKSNLGTLSLIFGIVGVLSIFSGVGALALIGFFAALAALILGIKGLKRDRHDLKALFGLILGSGYMILLLLVVIVLASWDWY